MRSAPGGAGEKLSRLKHGSSSEAAVGRYVPSAQVALLRIRYDTAEAIIPDGRPTNREGQITSSKRSVMTTAHTSPMARDAMIIGTRFPLAVGMCNSVLPGSPASRRSVLMAR